MFFRPSPALPIDLDDCYLLPSGIVSGEVAAAAIVSGNGWPIADGPQAFTAGTVVWREGGATWGALLPFAELAEIPELARTIHRIGSRRKPWAGLVLDRPLVMGIVNTTPDSFSDGGDHLAPEKAIAAGVAMVGAGAAIIDVGGESTRPGAAPVSIEDELARTLPVVRALAERGITVSIDTRHPQVMRAAVAAGARVINDVAALREPGALEAAAETGAAVCLMHMRGEPRTMQEAAYYDCAPLQVYDFLAERTAACEAAGIPLERIAVDPGIGFGKTDDHNRQILGALALYHGLGCPLLLGASRKSFIGRLSKGEAPKDRLPGSLAAAQLGWQAGVQMVRVHDVAETVQALTVWRQD